MYLITTSNEVVDMVKLKSNNFEEWHITIVGDLKLIKIDEKLASGWRDLLHDYGIFNFDIVTGNRARDIIQRGGVRC